MSDKQLFGRTVAVIAVGVAIAFVLFYCIRPTAPKQADIYENIGIITSVSVVPTSFNECTKMQITTTKRFLVIIGLHSIPIGVEASMITVDEGNGWKSRALTWKNDDLRYYRWIRN